MTDIARLGLAVDTTQVKNATNTLNQLADAAEPAATAVDTVAQSADALASVAASLETALERAVADLTVVATAADNGTTSLTEFATGTKTLAGVATNLETALERVVADINLATIAAENGTGGIESFANSQRSLAAVTDNMESALERAVADINVEAVAVKNGTAAVSGHASAHGGLSTQAMAAQHSIRSFVEQIALGIPVTQAATGQMNHLTYAASGPGGIKGAFKEAAGSILGMISPTALAAGGLAALAAGGVLVYNSIIKTEKAFADTSQQAGIATTQLHSFATAASFKGIDSSDFLKAMDKFAGDVYQAQNGMGQLGQLLRANGESAGTFEQAFGKVADLIKNATSDQQRLQILQQAGLPATLDWVRFMSQGAAGIQAAMNAAAKFDDSAEAHLVDSARKFDQAWGSAWKNFSDHSKSAVLTAVDQMSSLSTVADKLAKSIGNADFWKNLVPLGTKPEDFGLQSVSTNESRIGGAFTALSEAPPVSGSLQRALQDKATALQGKATKLPADMAKQISDQQTYIGLLGQTATAEQLAQQVQLQADATYLSTGVSVGQKKIDQLKQLAVENAIGVIAIKAQTDAEKINAATIGMSVGDAAEYTAVQNALNAAKQKGTVLSAASVSAIKDEASALGEAADRADTMKSAYNGLVQGPMETFTSQIAQGASAMNALKAAGVSALDAIAKQLADMAAQSLWTNAFGGSSGGIFSSIFGGSSTTTATGHHTGYGPGDAATFTRVLPSAIFASAPRFHSGIGPGERAAVIRNDESVLTPGQMRALAPAGSGGAQHVSVGVTVDDTGGLQAYVKNVSQAAVGSFAASPQFVDHVASASKRARSQRKL